MATPIQQYSFAGGEIAPGLWARGDLLKYHNGAALLLNHFIDYRGGASSRPGTAFVGRTLQGNCGLNQSSTVVYIVNGTATFTVPADVTILASIEMWGSGASWNSVVGQSGGAGAYTKVSNVAVTPGQVINLNIPLGGSGVGGALLNNNYTWWGTINTYRAQCGSAIPGAAANGIGDIKYSGGSAGPSGGTNGGGGGAAGPLGDGAKGGSGFDRFKGGAGGGASNTGSVGSSSVNAHGANGGANSDGAAGGVGSGTGNGGNATNAGSGGGGAFNDGIGGAFNGGNGADDRDNGGGGGGGASPDLASPRTQTGGNGGFPGGASGGQDNLDTAIHGVGGNGQIKVTYGTGGVAIVTTGAGCPTAGTSPCEVPPPRLIPFTFSTVQTYILEFGNFYMRPIIDGGYVLEPSKTITGITQAVPGVVTAALHGFSNGDWVFVDDVVGMTEVNNRTFLVANAATNTFQLVDLDGQYVDTTGYTAYASGGTVSRLFTLATPYADDDLPLLKFAQSADVMTITHPSYAPRDLTRTQHYVWTLTAITFAPDISPPTGFTVTGDNSGSTTYRYEVTAVSQTSSEESRPSAIAQITNALAMSINAGERVHIKWLPVAGAAYYNVYRQPEVTRGAPDWGQQYGFIGTTTGVSMTDQNILPDFSRGPPQARNPFANAPIRYWTVTAGGSGYTTGLATVTDATGSGWVGFIEAVGGVVTAIVTQYGGENYTAPTISAAGGSGLTATATLGPATGNWPACVTYFQQRKVFAATTNSPETLWMTQIGNFQNMDVSIPARDSDAITATIASTQVNAIKFLLPMASGLIVGSSSGAWQVSGGSVGEPVTPSNIVASPQAFNGSSDVPPIPVNYDILYMQAKSNVVRQITYNFYQNSWVGSDMTVLANHLFYGFAVDEWSYQDEPPKVVWGIRDDGILLSFTFLKEQEVYAWCHSDTQGHWKSVATISEGDEDAVYEVAQRTIPGVNAGQPVYYTERMASRQMKRAWTNPDINNGADVVNAWFLDCALRYGPDLGPTCITPSALTGTIVLTTDADAFTTASVGDVVRLNGGIMTIATYTSATVVSASVIVDLVSTDLAVDGDWTMTAPVTEVDGLDHLIGASVMVLSNGSVEGPYTVSSTGTVTLQASSDIVLVGLAYTPQGTTLYLDTGTPTIAGKRKAIPGVTVFVENTRGLKFSSSGFDNLVAMKERTDEKMGQPTRLTTGQERINVYSDWTTGGQVYWQQDYPLPVTVLGLVPDVSVGDTEGRG